ncbi:hypothetical protein PIB30_085680, partial [Stylosanthes scabra]|nr:hypothetical protein [Stylosanthes scabra]
MDLGFIKAQEWRLWLHIPSLYRVGGDSWSLLELERPKNDKNLGNTKTPKAQNVYRFEGEERKGKHDTHTSKVKQLWNQLSTQLLLSNEKERGAKALFIAIDEWHFRNYMVWSVPGQIFNVGVRVHVPNILMTTLISLFSLYLAFGGIKPVPLIKLTVRVLVQLELADCPAYTVPPAPSSGTVKTKKKPLVASSGKPFPKEMEEGAKEDSSANLRQKRRKQKVSDASAEDAALGADAVWEHEVNPIDRAFPADYNFRVALDASLTQGPFCEIIGPLVPEQLLGTAQYLACKLNTCLQELELVEGERLSTLAYMNKVEEGAKVQAVELH